MKKKIKTPSQVFKHCPDCKSTDLVLLPVDVLCGSCDWSSLEQYVESGGMDQMISAHSRHFDLVAEAESLPVATKKIHDTAELTEIPA